MGASTGTPNVFRLANAGGRQILGFTLYQKIPTEEDGESDGYKYGFNGKENLSEIYGEGVLQDYGFRIYNTNIARFLSVDPLRTKYAWNSNYAFAENSPLTFIDRDGLERFHYTQTLVNGVPQFTLLKQEDIVDYTLKPIFFLGTFFSFEIEKHLNERQEHVLHYEKEGTVENYNSAQFVTYDETITYQSYENMTKGVNGERGWGTFKQYAKKGMTNVVEEQRVHSGGGGSQSGSIWKIRDPLARGFVYEAAAGGNLVRNYPVIDKFVDGVATSIKTLDLRAKTYQTGNAVYNTLKGYINKLHQFNGARVCGFDTRGGAIREKILEVAIPKGATTEQIQMLQKAVSYGKDRGITVNIKTVQ